MWKAITSFLIAAIIAAVNTISVSAQPGDSPSAKSENSAAQIAPHSGISPPVTALPQIQERARKLQSAIANQTQEHREETIKWTDKIIAFFTIVLGLCSIAGGVIAYFQWRALQSQVDRLDQTIERADAISARQADETQAALAAAQKAANAADLSAKAAIGVELPFLYVESFSFDNEFPATALEFPNWCKVTSPKIVVKNYGRTPAFVSSIVINAGCGPLPTAPKYEIIREYPIPLVVDGRAERDFSELLFKAEKYFTWEDIEAVKAGKKWLYIYGVIYFTDFLGTPHSRGCIFGWASAKGQFTNACMIYPKYDYQT